MSNFPILDLVAGMIFFYFLLSIICSSAVEMILTGFKARAEMLKEWLTEVFKTNEEDGVTPAIVNAIINHRSLTALSDKDKSTDYIAPANFATALLDQVSISANNVNEVPQTLAAYVDKIKATTKLPPEMQRVLLTFAVDARDAAITAGQAVTDIALFKQKIENWYDSNMDRVTGRLKTKYSRPFTFVVAAIVALALNADSITMAKYLYNNPEARAKIAGNAYEAVNSEAYKKQVEKLKANSDTSKEGKETLQELQDTLKAQWKEINTAKATLEENSVPLGWGRDECKQSKNLLNFIFTKFVGLLFTFLAIIMGAPFWFELLNKLANLRSSGVKPKDSNKKVKK